MALLTASALGKTIRENDIDSLYYFYGHDTAADVLLSVVVSLLTFLKKIRVLTSRTP